MNIFSELKTFLCTLDKMLNAKVVASSAYQSRSLPLYTSRGDTCKAPPSLKEGLSRTPHGSQALQDSGALGPMLLSEERPGRKHPVSVNTGPFYPKNLKKKNKKTHID